MIIRAPFVYPPNFNADNPVRLVAHGLRAGKAWAVQAAAKSMHQLVTPGATLVPMPSSDGSTSANFLLARAIVAEMGVGGASVAILPLLAGERRPSQYETKKAGRLLTGEELKMRAVASALPEHKVILIDNVVDSGETARAALTAMGQSAMPVEVLVWAVAPHWGVGSVPGGIRKPFLQPANDPRANIQHRHYGAIAC